MYRLYTVYTVHTNTTVGLILPRNELIKYTSRPQHTVLIICYPRHVSAPRVRCHPPPQSLAQLSPLNPLSFSDDRAEQWRWWCHGARPHTTMRTSQSQGRGGRGRGPRGDPDQEADGGEASVRGGAGAEVVGTLGLGAGAGPLLLTATDFISEVRVVRGVSELHKMSILIVTRTTKLSPHMSGV